MLINAGANVKFKNDQKFDAFNGTPPVPHFLICQSFASPARDTSSLRTTSSCIILYNDVAAAQRGHLEACRVLFKEGKANPHTRVTGRKFSAITNATTGGFLNVCSHLPPLPSLSPPSLLLSASYSINSLNISLSPTDMNSNRKAGAQYMCMLRQERLQFLRVLKM